jgi:hypothetical protein
MTRNPPTINDDFLSGRGYSHQGLEYKTKMQLYECRKVRSGTLLSRENESCAVSAL